MAKIIINNSYSKLVDTEPALLGIIDDVLSVKQPGYFFSPSFKNGVWDGKIRFLNKRTNTFPSGLLEKVLKANESDFEIVDDRKPIDVEVSPEIVLYEPDSPTGTITLRDYQHEAVKKAIELKRGIVNVATNGGKTEIASGIIKELLPHLKSSQRILFITHSKEIMNQSAERIETRLGIKVGKVGDGVWDEKQVTIVMVPTISKHIEKPTPKKITYTKEMKAIKLLINLLGDSLKKGEENRQTMINAVQVLEEQDEKNYNPKAIEILTEVISTEKSNEGCLKAFRNMKKDLKGFEEKALRKKTEKHEKAVALLESAVCFIADEAHHGKSKSWFETLMLCTNAVHRIGLTGTVDRKDEINTMRLFGLTGEILIKITNEFLISKGFSAKPTIFLDAITEPKLSGNLEYAEAYEKGIIENAYRNTRIADKVKEKYDEGKVCLIIVNRKKHGENIAKLLEERGIKYEYVHGSRSTEDRQEALDAVKNGALQVLIATNILDEGVSVSNLDAVFMAAGGKSFRVVLQRVGRSLRAKKGKENTCEIYDYLDYTQRHLTKHTQERYSYYKNEKFKIEKVKR